MEDMTKEMAAVLRSTESMAAEFAQRVQERVGVPVSHTEILAAMQKISSRSLSLEKVVTKVQQRQEQQSRRASRSKRRPSAPSSRRADTAAAASPDTAQAQEPRTIVQKLEAVLRKNWDRAEAEGLHPDRMPTEAFVNAVHRYSDRREAIPRRILQAATQLDRTDVLLTPALVADGVHKLFQG
jgi:hypothetical protein